MKITYLGTSAAEGFPAVFCNCAHCRQARSGLARELRTRSQILIENDLLVDFPPESYLHALRFGVDLSAVRAVLVTHSHTDHFYAQEFVNRGYKFAFDMTCASLDIVGNAEVRAVYEEGTRREIKGEVADGINFRIVYPFEELSVCGYEVFTLPASHTPHEQALLYAIRKEGKTFLVLNDTGLLREECYSYLAENGIRADSVSLDCTFLDNPGPNSLRHMGFRENELVREKMVKIGICGTNTKYYVTHFSHNNAPFRERAESEAAARGFIAAHDGLSFEI